MSRLKSYALVPVLLCLLTFSSYGWAGEAVTVTVNAAEMKPAINPFIYGQFIEHLGRCIYGGIWAEMLEDRKFYFPITEDYDPYKKLADSPFPVVGASPWEIVGEAGHVTMAAGDSFVGKHTPRIAPGGGIRQRDLGVVAGKKYVGYIWLKGEAEKDCKVSVALVCGKEPAQTQEHIINAVSEKYEKYPFLFAAGVDTDHATLEIKVDGSAVMVGTVSLMPAGNVRGMRADTLAMLKQLDAPMYRWPGGNFVSGYNWRDGIGPRDKRPPRKNPAWTGVEHNDMGVDEFIAFCREVNAEPLIAANTGFGDAYSAAQEVEYCNGGADTVAGAWRRENGHAAPYGVKYWCVGNEMFGAWQLGFMQLHHYVLKHNRCAEAMLAVDPGIKLIGVGNLDGKNPRHDPDQKVGWTEGMLSACAGHMDYISEHFYRGRVPWSRSDDKADVLDHIGLMRDSIREKVDGHRALQEKLGLLPDRLMPIAMDEWNYWHRKYDYGELGCVYDLQDALGVAVGLHEYFRNSDIIHMAHYAQTVNVIGCIKTTKTRAFFSATGLPLMLYRRHFGTIPVQVSGDHEAKHLDVSAALSEDKKTLTVAVVNPNGEAVAVALKPEGCVISGQGRQWVVRGDDPRMFNDADNERLKAVESETAADAPWEVPPYSFVIRRLPIE